MAGIPLGSGFNRTAGVPLDLYDVVADSTARDAIGSSFRYEGMAVYVIADTKTYQLQGGITNSDWVEYGAGGGGGSEIATLVVEDTDDVSSVILPDVPEQTINFKGDDGLGAPAPIDFSVTPFGVAPGPAGIRCRFTLHCVDANGPGRIVFEDSTWGCVGPFSEINIQKYETVTFERNDELQRMIYVSGKLS